MVLKSEEEAMNWFLSNSTGSVFVENKIGSVKEVDCYPDAKAWLESNEKLEISNAK